jgi:hypothetical protein
LTIESFLRSPLPGRFHVIDVAHQVFAISQ